LTAIMERLKEKAKKNREERGEEDKRPAKPKPRKAVAKSKREPKRTVH